MPVFPCGYMYITAVKTIHKPMRENKKNKTALSLDSIIFFPTSFPHSSKLINKSKLTEDKGILVNKHY